MSGLLSHTSSLLRDWYGLPLAALAGLLAALYYVLDPDVMRPIFDDSYISLAYAQNLADHGKLSFDGQAWSSGATSPLHVFVLAVVLKLGLEPFQASVYVGVASHALLSSAVYLLAWSIFRSRLTAALAALTIAFTSYAALDAGNGLETSLFMALVSLAMASFFLGKSPRARALTGALIALTFLTRPEGGFLVPAVLIYSWIDRDRADPLTSFFRDDLLLTAPAALAFGGISLYHLIVSDNILGTAGAKLQFFREFDQPLQTKLSKVGDLVGLFAGPLLTLIVLSLAVPRRKQIIIFGLFWIPIVVLYAYAFPGGLSHYFYRYQHPMLPLLAVMAAAGATYAITFALRSDLVVKALVLLALGIAVVPIWKQYERWQGIYTLAATETFVDLEGMAQDLNTIIKPNEVLATHDIGAVAYFADYEVLDLVGLVNLQVGQYHSGRNVTSYLQGAKPDYLLIFPEWDRFFLHINPEADPDRYQLIKVYEGGSVRPQPYRLYRVNYAEDP